MAKRKSLIDYKKLPFEVHFSQIDSIQYEFYYDPEKPPKDWTEYNIVELLHVSEFDVTFACNDASGGRLIHILGGHLDEYIPDWLTLVQSGSAEPGSGELSYFTFNDDMLKIGDQVSDSGYGELEPTGEGISFYRAKYSQPDYLVLDADGTRLVVDSEGYMLDEDDCRMEDRPVVRFTEKQLASTSCRNFDWDDLSRKLLESLKSI